MTFEILETSIQLSKGGKVFDRVEARFTLNGRFQRLTSCKYAMDLVSQFDNIIADETEHLIDTKNELIAEIKNAIKEGKIKKKYNTLKDMKKKGEKITNDNINRLFRRGNSMAGCDRSEHGGLPALLRLKYYEQLRGDYKRGKITGEELSSFTYYYVHD